MAAFVAVDAAPLTPTGQTTQTMARLLTQTARRRSWPVNFTFAFYPSLEVEESPNLMM
jgi:hypothetical protein